MGEIKFLNEIIWAYDYGGRSTKRWPAKHDNILMYVKDEKKYTFNNQDIDRIPYMAPGLVGKEKAAKGRNYPQILGGIQLLAQPAKRKLDIPPQKPLGILKRIIRASSNPGDMILDFFAGSGTTGGAALDLGRNFILIDSNPEAIDVMRDRFADKNVNFDVLS